MNLEHSLASTLQCNVCQHALNEPLYRSDSARSLTTLRRFIPVPTEVYFCQFCAHVQTRAFEELDSYYAHAYDLLLNSEEEDELYSIENGKPVLRLDHEFQTIERRVPWDRVTRVLDFGCGKGAVMRKLSKAHPSLQIHCFDLSNKYTPFWQQFTPLENTAVRVIPAHWKGKMDLVTSFFALEHVEHPRRDLETIHSLLKEGGELYFLVPDLFQNPAELVVVDHLNHFTEHSLECLLQETGFEIQSLDKTSHSSAILVRATKRALPHSTFVPRTEQVDDDFAKAQSIARFWSDLASRISAFEKTQKLEGKSVVYGAGFYGAFVASRLSNIEHIAGFVDRDPHKQSKTLFDKPILLPTALPESVSTVYVALNPQIAKAAIDSIDAWKDRGLEYFYL
jgi:SAM-dependent methyltransferase